ncbi:MULTISPECIES: hypothetical protein [unclassified Cohnella]|uniref:hypothetical protein n=1 Tax=unclassified Cohnella TaxID=2636738 RepID=UPI00117D8514
MRGGAAILIDSKTSYKKNINKRIFPASITKIVTGVIAMESSAINDVLKVSPI